MTSLESLNEIESIAIGSATWSTQQSKQLPEPPIFFASLQLEIMYSSTTPQVLHFHAAIFFLFQGKQR